MARTNPVHSGYTIINGTGTGSNGERIDVWVEYLIGTADASANTTPFTAYFYAALNPAYTSSTYNNDGGLNSTFTVDGESGQAVSNGSYDFRSAATVNFLGSYSGDIVRAGDGEKTISIEGSFSTASSYISGGNISAEITLPAIKRGLVHIDNGSDYYAYRLCIDNGTSWDQYALCIDNGTSWDM